MQSQAPEAQSLSSSAAASQPVASSQQIATPSANLQVSQNVRPRVLHRTIARSSLRSLAMQAFLLQGFS